ncbi:MAG: hypothetical protein MUO76_00775 [Anaerolineaceae bacterium]|nr:hypothetical protein [Anaerolineaceae bacterium]
MKESVAIAKEAAAKKDFSLTKSDNSTHRVVNKIKSEMLNLSKIPLTNPK